ncbi:sulfurtransferase [Paeniglutamicibacter sp. NPDC012692]|uniref:sulfurtransferase n=1 Tax=Paeniglutamicibacter sp. NPDC012692 TaxID=3364388 RepID=UPI003688C78B
MALHPLIEAQELHALLAAPGDVVLLDVRWALGDPNGHAHYLDGHLPGAVFVDLHHELAAAPTPEAGRHPLPTAEAFHAAAQRWGINPGSRVVVYDATRALAAARAWWLLRHAGFENVRVLNGGLDAWTGAGYPLERGEHTAAAGTVELGWDRLPTIDIDEAENFPGALLDARAFERYTGATEPIDPRAGHIPGALSNPTTENLGADGRFLDPSELAERFAALGVQASDGEKRPVAAYCGSGVTAAHQILALETIGVRAALFPGSWSQYSADPTRTPATGETP